MNNINARKTNIAKEKRVMIAKTLYRIRLVLAAPFLIVSCIILLPLDVPEMLNGLFKSFIEGENNA